MTLWRNTRTLPSMSTMLVTSGLAIVTTAVIAGIWPLMEPSAALLELLTVHSTWQQPETTIVIITAKLKVIAITFRKERCEWDSRLESASLAFNESYLHWRSSKSSAMSSCHVIIWTFRNSKKRVRLMLCSDVIMFVKQQLLSNLYLLKNKAQKHWILILYTNILGQ